MDEMRNDVLKEIANIGSGHAATALAALVNCPIVQSVPKVMVVPLADMPDLLGGAEKVTVAGMLDISGDFSGFLILFLDLKQAEKMVAMVKGEPATHNEKLSIHRFSVMDRSVLSEIVNIMGGSYLTAISEFTSLSAKPSVPYLCVDMLGSILSIAAAEMGKTGDYAILFESGLFNEDERITSDLFLLPDEKSCKRILESLGFVW